MADGVRAGLPDTARPGLVVRVSVPFEGEVMTGEVTADPDRLLTGPEVCALLGIEPGTWRTYVCRGQAPVADDPGVGPANRRTPRWRLSTVREYSRGRRRATNR